MAFWQYVIGVTTVGTGGGAVTTTVVVAEQATVPSVAVTLYTYEPAVVGAVTFVGFCVVEENPGPVQANVLPAIAVDVRLKLPAVQVGPLFAAVVLDRKSVV